MRKLILLLLIFTQYLYSQQIKLSKDSLYFPSESSADELTLYNIGTSTLLIDDINSTTYLGYHLNISFKDTTIYTNVLPPRGPKLSFSIEPEDSVNLFFFGPYCPVCKRYSFFYDTLIIHSNSVSDSDACIYVKGQGSLIVENNHFQVKGYVLEQNYPNPFNPRTLISFYLPYEEYTTLSVYNELGQEMSTLFSGRLRSGNCIKTWDATGFTSGVYFYKLETKYFSAIKKMILLK